MNEQLFRTLLKRYEAVIEDCMYKIQSLNENNIEIILFSIIIAFKQQNKQL